MGGARAESPHLDHEVVMYLNVHWIDIELVVHKNMKFCGPGRVLDCERPMFCGLGRAVPFGGGVGGRSPPTWIVDLDDLDDIGDWWVLAKNCNCL